MGGAIATHQDHRGGARSVTAPRSQISPAGTAPSSTTVPSAPSTTIGGTGPTDATTLQTDLLVANDLGGYYTSIPADSASQLAASGCLAGLGVPPDGKVRAVQYLRGPFNDHLPDINEQLTSYATVAEATSVYGRLSQILVGCRSTPVTLAGGQATATLAPLAVPGVGDQAAIAQGPFTLGSLTGKLTVAVVRMSTTIIVFVYADRTPPSLAILGTPQSTLRAAVGKASP